MIRSYYRCCCINEPVIFSQCVHLKLGHRFHALLKVYSDRDDTVPLNETITCIIFMGISFTEKKNDMLGQKSDAKHPEFRESESDKILNFSVSPDEYNLSQLLSYK